MDGQALSWTPRTLGHFLEKHARERGTVEAVVTHSNRLSYAGLLRDAKGVAGYLQSIGIGRGDHIGILMGNDEKWLALFYGAALLGAVTVPVNTRFKAAEIEYGVKQSDCKLLFYVPRFMSQDFESATGSLGIPRVDVSARLPEGRFTPAGVSPEDTLLIQFTSGTTAYPKGVMLSHDMMLRDAWAAGERVGIRPEDRYFNCRPFFHVAGSTLSALMALADTAMYAIILAYVWQGSGFYMALMLSGLKSINTEIWSAARLDGVSVWRLYIEIIIPMMKFTFLTCAILLSLGVVKAYDVVVAMTNGGPGQATWVPAYFTINAYWVKSNLGFASAAAVIMLLITAAIFLPLVLLTAWRERSREARVQ